MIITVFIIIVIISLSIIYFTVRNIPLKLENTISNLLLEQKQTSQNEIKLIHENLSGQLSVQKGTIDAISNQIMQILHMNDVKFESIRSVIDIGFNNIQKVNDNKLEQIRETVNEKLHGVLETKLGESFKIVSERLEMVHKGLGEMQNLAAGVGDLKKVLTNVKTRGIWGEVQLEAILEQLLTKEQYIKNASIKPQEFVEFAIKLPGQDNQFVLLPIDAKFPLADYQQLIAAQENSDNEMIQLHSKILETSFKKIAKTISDKYIYPPYTTDFAIMFLPIESLYAEALRRPGLVETIQQNYKIIITGPTTFSAILTSLQMGFRTLAIEKRSSDVWKLLEVIQSDLARLESALIKTKTKIEQASMAVSDAESKSRGIYKKLKGVYTNDDNVKIDNEEK